MSAGDSPLPRARSSLRTKAAVRTSLLTATVIFVMATVFFVEVKSMMEDQLAKRGRALAKSIGVTSELALFSGRGQDAAETIDPFFRGDREVLYVILIDKDERLILSRIRHGRKELSAPELVRLHRSMGSGPFEVHDYLRSPKVEILGFTEVVRVHRREMPLAPLYEEEAGTRPTPGAGLDGGMGPDGGARRDGGTTADGGAAKDAGAIPKDSSSSRQGAPPSVEEAEERILSIDQTPAPRTREVGRVLLGLSQEPLTSRLWTLAKITIAVGLAALLLLLGALFGASRSVFQRIARMVTLANHISRGDLTHRVEIDTDDELGILGESLNRISTNLGRTLGRVQDVTGNLTDAADALWATAEEVVAGAQVQSDGVGRTQVAVEEMSESLRAIATDIGVLTDAARQSGTSIQEMTSLNQEVLQQVLWMSESVDETASSIEKMARSNREVAQSVENQSAEAARGSRSMVDMDLAIREVQATADQSAELSVAVRQDAERGAESVGRFLRGIRRIEKQSEEVLEAMQRLDRKVRSVGMILGLIDEIAEQVNLLSLNAAIIAAQAGEHGKAFGVVVDEIKELADRTSASTREINELVKSIQAESQNSAHAVVQAARNIEAGVHLSASAEQALSKIVESARRGAAMAQAIARATMDQARGSEVVTDSSRRIADAVSHVATATSEQARSGELIARSARRMREITLNVSNSCQAEAEAAEKVSQALERITHMSESLLGAQQSQSRSARDVRQAMENIHRVAEGHRDTLATLRRAVDTLSTQARTLGSEVERFTLPRSPERPPRT